LSGEGVMTTFVLVHGAWHGGWCWSRTARLLRAQGHEVHAPTLTGVGERAHLAGTEVNLSLHIRDICNALACFIERIKLGAAHEKITRRMHILAEGWGPSPFVAFNERLRKDPRWKTAILKCGHDAMVDDPEGLAKLLLDA